MKYTVIQYKLIKSQCNIKMQKHQSLPVLQGIQTQKIVVQKSLCSLAMYRNISKNNEHDLM